MDDRSPFLWNLVGVQAARPDIQHHTMRRMEINITEEDAALLVHNKLSHVLLPCQNKILSWFNVCQ